MNRHAFNRNCNFYENVKLSSTLQRRRLLLLYNIFLQKRRKIRKEGKNLHLLTAVHGAGNQIRNHDKRNGEHRQELPEKRLLRFAKEKAEPV